MSFRADIEDAVIELLEDVAVLKKVAPYNGELGGDNVVEGVKRVLLGNLPGVLVQVCDASTVSVSTSRRRSVKVFEIDIIVAASTLRSREETNRDAVTGGRAGAYDAIEAIELALQGVELDVDGVGRLVLQTESVIVQTPDLTVFECTYRVPCDARGPASETGTEITSIEAQHNLVANDDGEGDEANPVAEAIAGDVEEEEEEP
jgi:hypothetical protein